MSEAMQAAVRLTQTLGLVPTFRNLYIREAAIKAESSYASISVQEAADRIIKEGKLALEMGESLDYFWFEDCCWRYPKHSFKERDEMRNAMRMRAEACIGR